MVTLLQTELAPLTDADDLDEDMLQYVAGTLTDTSLDPEDLVDAVAPFLLDAGAAEDEDDAAALCSSIMAKVRALRLGEAGADGAVAQGAGSEEPVLLKERVIVKTSAVAADAKIAQLLTATLDQGQQGGNVNAEIKVYNLHDCDTSELTETQLREMIKSKKRDAKRFVKDTRLEKASAERRNALIQALMSRPVILHRDETCATIPDINLNNVQMDLDGKVLLEDCTCSIVAGRRYGLVGKNGSGKTTFLRHRECAVG